MRSESSIAFRRKISYYRRVFSAYLTPARSHLDFWHETPEINENVRRGELGEYYMVFASKADYRGPYGDDGIPLLDYRGSVGQQYNPIAIAQYGLGNYNAFYRTGDKERRRKFIAAADWLKANLSQNDAELWVWNHHFDWDYRETLKAPWFSSLAQGQGISLLVRAHHETGNDEYMCAAESAFTPFLKTTDQGGVSFIDGNGNRWFEEYIVYPPTHILNGFIWSLWGVYDYSLATGDNDAKKLVRQAGKTLAENLKHFDTGFWSLYEQSGTRLRMLASPFYHRLHIVQLKVMFRLTGLDIFSHYAQRWEGFQKSTPKRVRALVHKALFKFVYY
ncbi:D-glucuronyl C5-epimerase family protein [Dehalococcoidia bacterium]|nr:D-glucuronyl C5-epimerase family protein [Dehalococcoidia bacterium]